MEQPVKRTKVTKDSLIADIAFSISDIAKSVKSISESYSDILRINKSVVTYLRHSEEHNKKKELQDLENITITRKQ